MTFQTCGIHNNQAGLPIGLGVSMGSLRNPGGEVYVHAGTVTFQLCSIYNDQADAEVLVRGGTVFLGIGNTITVTKVAFSWHHVVQKHILSIPHRFGTMSPMSD